jgi:hypothetical protein
LEGQAKHGDTQAVLRIREIAKSCHEILDRLSPGITKKPSKLSIPSNALALLLLRTVKSIKNSPGEGGYPLAVEIKALRPLNKKTFPAWWLCAWRIAKDDMLRSDEMGKLIDRIWMSAPSVKKRLEERKKKAIEIHNSEMGKAAPGIALDNSPKVRRKIIRQLEAAVHELYAYVRRKTRHAALRVWFDN